MHVHKACAGLCRSLKDVIRPGERYEGLKNSFRPNACRSGLRNLIGGGTLSRVSCRPCNLNALVRRVNWQTFPERHFEPLSECPTNKVGTWRWGGTSTSSAFPGIVGDSSTLGDQAGPERRAVVDQGRAIMVRRTRPMTQTKSSASLHQEGILHANDMDVFYEQFGRHGDPAVGRGAR